MKVTDLADSWHMDAARIEYRGRGELVFKGRIFRGLSRQADMIADNKLACKRVLSELRIPVAEALVFADAEAEEDLISQFLRRHRPAVCKPLDGTEGIGVLMDAAEPRQIEHHWQTWKGRYRRFMLERQVAGSDLRIQVIGGRLAAACIRIPATLKGDGRCTVQELIEKRNLEIARQNPANHIDLDDQVHELLNRAGLGLGSVPEEGRETRIKNIANMSQGARAVDVTDRLHGAYVRWATLVAETLELPMFSMDVVTPNIETEPGQETAVLEINSRAAWLHHTFSEIRQHDIPLLILNHLFGLV